MRGPANLRAPRLHLIAMQAHEATPVALVGPAVRAWTRELCEPLLIAQLGAPRDARRRFEIVGARLVRRAAALRDCEHLEFRDDALEGERDSSPRRTACAGFTRSAFRWTLPPVIAAVASERVL